MSELVVAASAVVSWLLDDSGVGEWVSEQLASSRGQLVAPAVLPVEVASARRRAERSGTLPPPAASLALEKALVLPAQLHPFEPFAPRIWQLRHAVSTYDAWYVALAEFLDRPLLTLDARLSRAPGLRCPMVLPPA